MPGGVGFRSGPPKGFFPGHPDGFHRNRGFGTVTLPWYLPYGWGGPFAWDFPVWDYVNFPPSDDTWRGPSYQQSANTTSPQVIVVEKEYRRSPTPPPEPPKLIEVPPTKEVPVAKPLPATLFVLRDGERLERPPLPAYCRVSANRSWTPVAHHTDQHTRSRRNRRWQSRARNRGDHSSRPQHSVLRLLISIGHKAYEAEASHAVTFGSVLHRPIGRNLHT